MRTRPKRVLWFSLLLALLVAGAGLFFWLFGDLPGLENLKQNLNLPSVRITDRYGRLLYDVLPEVGGRHTSVPIESIPLLLQQATIATEDANFYQNPGTDIAGILRAFWINLRGGETLAGGSTITQQVARNLLLDEEERTERSLRRKLRESYLAWQLTQHFTKDEILALYLNQTNYGALAYGVEAAAQTYFGKPAAELDLAECALLAGLPQAPAIYNPFTDPEAAKERQAVVLRLMEEQGYITTEQRQVAERQPLALSGQPYPILAPHFSLWVSSQLDGIFTPAEIRQYGGLVVRTSLDLDWQRIAERAVARQLEALQQSPDGLGHNVNNAALVAIDPATGEILTMVGSPDYFDAEIAGAINMTLSPRQPGSSIKPIVYAAAINPSQPQPWTAATMILDVRTSFQTADGKAYTPANYDALEHGPVLLRQALASSLNIPAVATLDHIGLESMMDTAHSLGISTLGNPQDYDLSLALGGGAVRLLDLTAAFGAFANGGYHVTPRAILEITDPQGNVLYTPPASSQERVLDERVAWLISDILSDDEARAIGFGRDSVLNIGRPAAVKTGTTTNFHDNWTVGYTPELVVGVWAGNTDYQPMSDVTGLTGAAPIWHEYMRAVLGTSEASNFHRPSGMVQVDICSLSGLLPSAACPYQRAEWFIEGTQPTQEDTFYRLVEIDPETGSLAGPSVPLERRITALALALPPQALPWARMQGLLLYADLTGLTGGTPFLASSTSLTLVSPAANSVYHITNALPIEGQRIRIEAVGSAGLQEVSLWLDGSLLASFIQPPYLVWWTLEAGPHQAWVSATLPDGTNLTSTIINFEVIAP